MNNIIFKKTNVNLNEAEEILRCLRVIIDEYGLILDHKNSIENFKSLLEYKEKISLIIENKKNSLGISTLEKKSVYLTYSMDKMTNLVVCNSLGYNTYKSEIKNKKQEIFQIEKNIFNIKNKTLIELDIAKFFDSKKDYYDGYMPDLVTKHFVQN